MAVNTVGVKLLINTATVAELTSISGVGVTAETFESTILTDEWKEYKSKGLKEVNEFTVGGFFEPNDTSGQYAMWDALESGSAVDLSVLYPNVNAEYAGEGFITGFSVDAEVDGDGIQFEATIRPSGKWEKGLQASGGLTGLSMSGTGGTLAPTFGSAVRYYTYTGVTGASVTVTATAAGHDIKLYVNGAFTQNLTSGSASAAISLSAGTSKKLTIVASEPGKKRQVTDIIVQKN